ncbi:hypothetical protein STENM36S_07727 [Streptomyces tendae]
MGYDEFLAKVRERGEYGSSQDEVREIPGHVFGVPANRNSFGQIEAVRR